MDPVRRQQSQIDTLLLNIEKNYRNPERMRNFIIFFHEKSGTSALVRLLDKFESISIIHQKNYTGFEPFDTHQCGRMTLKNLTRCLDIIFGPEPINTEQLNRIYTATAKRPLDEPSSTGVVGFKMRFTPPNSYPLLIQRLPARNKFAKQFFRKLFFQSFKRTMFKTLKRHNVVVLMAVRQDVLRLGLSKYHGDGTGEPGHLQFKLARGEIAETDIARIQVDCERLDDIISKCEMLHAEDRRLTEELSQAGIQVHPILYEEFVTDKRSYLERLFRVLELDITSDEISQVLGQEEYFKKVHSDDISEFVENHEEVMNRFADRFVSWQ